MSNTYNITMTRGDTYSFSAKVSEDIAESVNQMYLSVKTRPTDASYVLQKSLINGIEKTDDYTYKIRIAPEDTANLLPGKYAYDFEVTVGDDVYTVMMGTLKLVQDITTRSTE